MQQLYSWPWVQSQVAQTIEVWSASGFGPARIGPPYGPEEQLKREQSYDQGLQSVEREAKSVSGSRVERAKARDRIVAAFARFSATALDLPSEAIQILTDEFLPVGTKLACWARRFDANLSRADIIQACRNAWTACGMQPLLGERIAITPSIMGYSLLYPYSDNFIDGEEITVEAKLRFSRRFRDRLQGATPATQSDREAALWTLVALIEQQYPRARFPQVFDCLLAIHRAQEESIAQVRSDREEIELLRMSCAKGGSSVLADACLARGWLTDDEHRFAFEWGVLLQLGDDLQDVREDMQRGSVTLFSRAAALGQPLDALVIQLLGFSERVGERMDHLPNGSPVLKALLRMSWRSLILGAVADSYQFFSPEFLEQAERCSPFRFGFLRARRERLTSRQGLYATLFDAFLEASDEDDGELPLPELRLVSHGEADSDPMQI
jgi:hypothetical protein